MVAINPVSALIFAPAREVRVPPEVEGSPPPWSVVSLAVVSLPLDVSLPAAMPSAVAPLPSLAAVSLPAELPPFAAVSLPVLLPVPPFSPALSLLASPAFFITASTAGTAVHGISIPVRTIRSSALRCSDFRPASTLSWLPFPLLPPPTRRFSLPPAWLPLSSFPLFWPPPAWLPASAVLASARLASAILAPARLASALSASHLPLFLPHSGFRSHRFRRSGLRPPGFRFPPFWLPLSFPFPLCPAFPAPEFPAPPEAFARSGSLVIIFPNIQERLLDAAHSVRVTCSLAWNWASRAITWSINS